VIKLPVFVFDRLLVIHSAAKEKKIKINNKTN
jgi:hypothetical protein